MASFSLKFMRTLTLMVFGCLAWVVFYQLLGPHPHPRSEKAVSLVVYGVWITTFSVILIRQALAWRRAGKTFDMSLDEKKRALIPLMLALVLYQSFEFWYSSKGEGRLYLVFFIAMSVVCILIAVAWIRKEVRAKAFQRATEKMEVPLSGD